MDSMSYPFFTLVFLSPPHQKAIERLFFLSVYREEDNSRQFFLLHELSFLFFLVIFFDLK